MLCSRADVDRFFLTLNAYEFLRGFCDHSYGGSADSELQIEFCAVALTLYDTMNFAMTMKIYYNLQNQIIKLAFWASFFRRNRFRTGVFDSLEKDEIGYKAKLQRRPQPDLVLQLPRNFPVQVVDL
jgi:hypothetical protein